jgi:hypothetical protein
LFFIQFDSGERMNFMQAVTSNGWQTKESFLHYVIAIVGEMREEGVTGHIIIFADGFPGHLCLELQIWCQENDVVFILLLPNATHLLQPLDVVIFRPVKAEYKNQLSAYKLQHKKTTITQVDLVRVIARTFKKVIVEQPDLVKKSFEVTGLFPLKNDAIQADRLIGQLSTQENSPPASLSSTASVSSPASISSPASVSSLPAAISSPATISSPSSASLEASIGPSSILSQAENSPDSLSSPMNDDWLSDILTIPDLPAIPKSRFKLPRQGNVSSKRVVEAYKEHAVHQDNEAKKKQEERRQKLKRREDALKDAQAKSEQRVEAKRVKLETAQRVKEQKAVEREMKKKKQDENKKKRAEKKKMNSK